MIGVDSSGSYATDEALRVIETLDYASILDQYGREGIIALANATPVDSGLTAESWEYEISRKIGGYRLSWSNRNIDDNGTPVVILIEYGHGTGTGGWVEGRDFINPAILPLFDQIANDIWKGVTDA